MCSRLSDIHPRLNHTHPCEMSNRLDSSLSVYANHGSRNPTCIFRNASSGEDPSSLSVFDKRLSELALGVFSRTGHIFFSIFNAYLPTKISYTCTIFEASYPLCGLFRGLFRDRFRSIGSGENFSASRDHFENHILNRFLLYTISSNIAARFFRNTFTRRVRNNLRQ